MKGPIILPSSTSFCSFKCVSAYRPPLKLNSALGQKALCAKMDICQAFRLLIINPADFDLLGIMFGGKYYVDKCLPMGCSISCSLFEKFFEIIDKSINFSLSSLSWGILTTIRKVSISNPKNLICVVGPIVLSSEILCRQMSPNGMLYILFTL
jgi:hypothetical protein